MEKKGNNTFVLGVVVAIIALLAIGCICYAFTMLMRKNNKEITNATSIANIADIENTTTNIATNVINNVNNNAIVNNSTVKNENEITDDLEYQNFTISKIEKTNEGYIIYTHLLPEGPRTVSQADYNNVLNGGTFKFRGREWVLSRNEGRSIILKEKNAEAEENTENEKNIAIIEDSIDAKYHVERTGSGAVAYLPDYTSDEITTFTVDNSVKCIGTFETYEYDANTKEIKIINHADTTKENTIDELIDILKTRHFYDTYEYYGECTGYFLDGKMLVLKCRDY